MFPIIDTRRFKTFNGDIFTLNVCWTKDKREIVRCTDGYYYLSKDGLRITKRRVKL